MSDKYRLLEKDEVIQQGDEVDICNDGWRDEPKWRLTGCAGKKAPDPKFPSHRKYRRKIEDEVAQAMNNSSRTKVNTWEEVKAIASVDGYYVAKDYVKETRKQAQVAIKTIRGSDD